MEWRKSYMDLMLVPLGLLCSILYHGWLWYTVRSQPHRTIIGVNSAGRRLWVLAMMKDNDKKNILVVQTLRNAIMGSTLMATTSILLCCGLAAVISSTYSIKKPVTDSVYGGQGELMVALKYVVLLLAFSSSFLCHSLSIRFLNQVGFLTNVPTTAATAAAGPVRPEYVCEMLEKGFLLNTMGNRVFYAALPLLLWIFGPVLVFVCSAAMVPVMYNLDMVHGDEDGKGGGVLQHQRGCMIP